MLVYIGIDWSGNKHDICFLNQPGVVMQQFEIPHTFTGFQEIDKMRRKISVDPKDCHIGIETSHNLLVDYLWDMNYSNIHVIHPKAVHSAQGRYRTSGAKDDKWDSRLIADMLRTDQGRYPIWKPDSLLTRQIRAGVRHVDDLTKHIVRAKNQLWAVLMRYYPMALNVFSGLDAMITFKFIQSYPTPEQAKALTREDFYDFARINRHSKRKLWPKCYSRIFDPYPETNPELAKIYSSQAVSISKSLEFHIREKKTWIKKLTQLFEQHPDRHIYASLPGTGEFLQPALLSKMGDDRNRFPAPEVLQAIAGTSPVTKRSGKRKVVYFRRACDRDFRNYVQQWAKYSLNQSAWANSLYSSISHIHTGNDAYRRIGNRWLEVLWRIWQNNTTYDDNFRLKQRLLRSKPQ